MRFLNMVGAGMMIAAPVSCSSDTKSQLGGGADSSVPSAAISNVTTSAPQFRILKTEAWGHRLERTLDIDVLVLDSNPTQERLQKIVRDAGEHSYHAYEAGGKEHLCNLMVRLHDKGADDPADDTAAYGTAHPTHPAFECVKNVPELWDWEYHTFTRP